MSRFTAPAKEKRKIERNVGIGPCAVPIYPVTAFSRVKGIDMESVWRIVGPTVDRNIDSPLWTQFCAVYIEGLAHGVAGSIDRTRDDEIRTLKAEVLDLRQKQELALSALSREGFNAQCVEDRRDAATEIERLTDDLGVKSDA